MSGVDDVQTGRKTHKAPYTTHNPIPTVQKYREEKQNRQEQYGSSRDGDAEERGKLDRLGDAYNTLRYGKEAANPSEETQPFTNESKNVEPRDEEVADDHAGRLNQEKPAEPTRRRTLQRACWQKHKTPRKLVKL
jgi:hypothetical protein